MMCVVWMCVTKRHSVDGCELASTFGRWGEIVPFAVHRIVDSYYVYCLEFFLLACINRDPMVSRCLM